MKSNEKRSTLIKMSNQVKMMRELCDPALEGCNCASINEMVKHVFYPAGNYNTYKGWLEEGYQVKKGSKSFPVWGKKRKGTKKVKGGEDKEYKFFPIANIFHESQVERIEEVAA